MKPPNLRYPAPTQRDLHEAARLAGVYADAHEHRLRWAIEHPKEKREVILRDVQRPASAERAEELLRALIERSR